MQSDPSLILSTLAIDEPLIGLYDAPDPVPFAPLVEPERRECVFSFRRHWLAGETLHLTRQKYGCGSGQLLGVQTRSREQMVKFLCDKEGLKASHQLMDRWLDHARHFEPEHEHLLIGPLQPGQEDYLRTVTFFVNPDQLAVLCAGAIYYHEPDQPAPLIATYGSGCMQLAAQFEDLAVPQAIIGATDQAMRQHLEPEQLALTVTVPMFSQLCQWAADPRSSLHNGFLRDLMQERGGSL